MGAPEKIEPAETRDKTARTPRRIRHPIPPEVLASLGRVIDRLYMEEAQAYMGTPREERAGHPFLDIARLHLWLAQVEHLRKA